MEMKKIPLFWPHLLKDEWIDELSLIFSDRWIGQGPKVEEFEKEFSKKFDYEYVLSLNSGSAALELAYELIGLKENDVVLTTVFTCTATNIPLVRRKVNLKFVDIDLDTFNMDLEDFKKKFNKDVKVVVVVNLGGLQCNPEIFKICKENNVPVVVDACQSLGIREKNGDYICYSFQAIKHFTSGDGGCLIVNNKDEYDRAKKLRWFGIDRDRKKRADWKCLVNHQMSMEIEEAGFKYHMNDIAASMALVGLKHSDEILEYRKSLCRRYGYYLKDYVKCIYGGSYWLFGIVIENRNEIMTKLNNEGVECDLIHMRNDIFKLFGGERQDLPNMNYVEDRYLYLPLNTNITLDDVDCVIGKLLCSMK